MSADPHFHFERSMDELINRVVNGSASEIEEAQILAWRRKAPENERYFQDLSTLLHEARSAAWEQQYEAVPPVGEIIARANRFRWDRWRRMTTARVFVPAARVTAIAAIILLTVLGFRRTQHLGQQVADPIALSTGEVVTGAAETATITLGDGTVVRLAPESRIRVVGEPGTREVWLDGRAYFAVTRNEQSPFRIRTHAGEAVVLGTRFDLQARDDDLRLLVVDGAVELDAPRGKLRVTAHQAAHATTSSPPVGRQIAEEDLQRELGWLGNFLVFENTPLTRVAYELSAHYGIPVEILDSQLGEQTVRGMFAGEELEDVLNVICRAVAAHCAINPTRVTISP